MSRGKVTHTLSTARSFSEWEGPCGRNGRYGFWYLGQALKNGTLGNMSPVQYKKDMKIYLIVPSREFRSLILMAIVTWMVGDMAVKIAKILKCLSCQWCWSFPTEPFARRLPYSLICFSAAHPIINFSPSHSPPLGGSPKTLRYTKQFLLSSFYTSLSLTWETSSPTPSLYILILPI